MSSCIAVRYSFMNVIRPDQPESFGQDTAFLIGQKRYQTR